MKHFDITYSWKNKLLKEFKSDYMKDLQKFLKDQIEAGKTILPHPSKIFNALNLTNFNSIKVVILGQDPYHGVGQANGLSFSVDDSIAHPPSLKNIFKELNDDLGIPSPKFGNLESWSKQGVLLLNTCLTVEKNRPGSHIGRGWEFFTDAVLEEINNNKENVAFVFWGRKAQKKIGLIDVKKHLLLLSPHPSPLSARNGFLGSKPFSKINSYRKENSLPPIDWNLKT